MQVINVNVGGKPRYALVHLPAHWDGKTSVPVVLSFHGLGSSAEQQRSTDGFVAHSDKENFIVVYPQAGGTLGSLGAAWQLLLELRHVFLHLLLLLAQVGQRRAPERSSR